MFCFFIDEQFWGKAIYLLKTFNSIYYFYSILAAIKVLELRFSKCLKVGRVGFLYMCVFMHLGTNIQGGFEIYYG